MSKFVFNVASVAGAATALPVTAEPSAAIHAEQAKAATTFGGGQILWDKFGVPHIYGKTEAAAGVSVIGMAIIMLGPRPA